jgi:hypothetical protein
MENNLDLIAGKRVLELGAGLLQASCCCFPGRGRMPASRLLPNPVETDDTDPGEAIAQKRTQAPAPWSIGWGATVGVALAGCGLLGLCLARSGAPGSVTVSGFDGYPSSTCAGGERTAQSKKKSVLSDCRATCSQTDTYYEERSSSRRQPLTGSSHLNRFAGAPGQGTVLEVRSPRAV